MAVSIVLVGLIIAGCNKEKFPSRDTSKLKPTPPPPPPPVDPTLVIFDAADKLTDWEVVGGGVEEKAGAREGVAYLKSIIHTGDDYMHFIKRRPTAVDPKLSVEDGQFVFWFYVSSVTDLKLDGQIELTSSGKSDDHEYSWNLADYIPGLKVGWNEMKLNFSTAAKSGDGGPDIHAFNFFRIYFWTNDKASHGDVTVGVDDLKFHARTKISESFNTCDVIDNWETAGNVGTIVKGWQVRLDDEGQILVKGPDQFEGYWNQPDATKQIVDANEWLHTGDVGEWQNGNLRLIDRARDFMVTAGGKSIRRVWVASSLPGVIWPCGGCRQKIFEFAADGCEVIALGPDGEVGRQTIEQLLPLGFRLNRTQVRPE